MQLTLIVQQTGIRIQTDLIHKLQIQQQWILAVCITSLVGICKFPVCIRIESRIELGIEIRIVSFQLQCVLIIKISNYK